MKRIILALALVAALQSRAQTVFLNFNTTGQYTGNFNPWNDNGADAIAGDYDFQESATGGVADSGCVSVFQSTDCTATYNSNSWNLAVNGGTAIVSVMVFADGESSGDKTQLGFTSAISNGLNGNPGVNFETFRFLPSSASSWPVYEQYCNNGSTTTSGVLATATVTEGHWYKFVVGITNISGAGGTLAAGCALYDYGTNGLTPGANLLAAAVIHAGLDLSSSTAAYPAIRAFEDSGISAWDNFLVFTPSSLPVITLSVTNLTPVLAGQTVTFEALADGPGTLSYAWFTNGISVTGATNYLYTTLPYNGLLTNIAVVISNANGLVTNSETIVPASGPVVSNDGATQILNTSAMVNGQVISTGGDTPNITIYYGTANGGTNASAWSGSVSAGAQDGAFSLQLSGLSQGATYYFTAQASNAAGVAWAVPSGSFATLSTAPSPTTFVNPFIGTSPAVNLGLTFSTGDVFPGAVYPRGLLQFSPDTPGGLPGGYNYPETNIMGFSLRHFSGRGCVCYEDISFKPILGTVGASPENNNSSYWSVFSHTNETASPGYYNVLLNDGVQVSLTATPRTGVAQFTFPATNAATLLIDAGSAINGTTTNTSIAIVGTNQIQGYATSTIGCSSKNYTIYFAAQFEQPFSNPGTWNGASVNPGTLSATGAQVGAFVTFNTMTNSVVLARVGISFVSISNALLNLAAEDTNWNFSAIQNTAVTAWSNQLSRITISGGTFAQLQTFYTALYHCFFHPNIFNDANGQYEGMDFQVHTVASGRNQYENISAWDLDRSGIQLISVLTPDVAGDIAQSLINWAQQGGGGLPLWVQCNRNSQANPGDGPLIMLASAYAFGATNFDTTAALQAMKGDATNVNAVTDGSTVRPNLASYIDIGYVPNDLNGESVSYTLEYNMADFALYQFTRQIGDTDPEDSVFLDRSGYWQNLFNTNDNLIQARDSSGAWVSGITASSSTGFLESSSIQGTLMVPFNVAGLFNVLGGDSSVNPLLTNFFTELNAGLNSGYEWVGNEPCECEPWEFDYAGEPWATQNTIQRIQSAWFTDSATGLPGNDDGGAISSWYVFSALGLFPEVPGVGGFVLGSPMFPVATLNLENGAKIVLQGENASSQNYYVQSLSINGSNSSSLWLPFSSLSNGATVVFDLTNTPTSWATAAADAPPSFPAPPPAPAFLTAVAGNSQTILSWQPSPGATSYNVKRATNSSGETTITNITVVSFADILPSNGVTFYYEVSALNAVGESPNSLEVSVASSTETSGWLLFDNFTLDNNGVLAGQTGSGGLGSGWINFGSGQPLVVNSGLFGGHFAQFNTNAPNGSGSYEAGLGIAGTSTAATVFLQFILPGIQPTNGEVGPAGSSKVVSLNFEMDTDATPTDPTSSASVQLNYDNSNNGSPNGFRIRNGGAFPNAAIAAGGAPYVPVASNVYDAWFVINASAGTYQVWLANVSVIGTNLDEGGLGAVPTLLYSPDSSTSVFGFRNGASGQTVNTFVAGFADESGTVPQCAFDYIYVDRSSSDLTMPPLFQSLRFNAPYTSSGNLILTGANGEPGTAYAVLETTNLAGNPIKWTTNSTGLFNSAGAFSNSIPLGDHNAQFFRIATP